MACSVAILYEGYPKPVFVGITRDQRTLVLVKRQMLKEAQEALDAAQNLGDNVLIADVEGTLDKLEKTLNLLISPELEQLYLSDEERRGTN